MATAVASLVCLDVISPSSGGSLERRRTSATGSSRCHRMRLHGTLCVLTLTVSAAVAGEAAAPAPAPGQRAADPALERSLGAEVEQFVRADRVSPPPPCQVLFVGPSSLGRWKETPASAMAPMPVIDRGFGGSLIEYVNRWFDEIVAPYRPRAIVFYAGENDIDAGKPVDRVVADFDEFMRRKTGALGD